MAQAIHHGSEHSAAILSVRIGDAIRITGIGRTKLFALIADGTLETTTIGRRRLILYRSLQRLIEGTAPDTLPEGA
ncbi:hypothetical protein MGWOODY_Smn2977 [hydrothermal vent metagenome]|uniref:Helix-turn-helix domain-containing protein n=1 Tax=hydrothermal vent metagenome TaxID=652676 RepID=A0A160TKD4_9ZZZZ